MALITPFFYLLGFKTISPDTTKIKGNWKIILTSNKSIPKLSLLFDCINEDGISTRILGDYEDGSPDEKLEIDYSNRDDCSLYSIDIGQNYTNTYVTIVGYNINYSKDSSFDFDRLVK